MTPVTKMSMLQLLPRLKSSTAAHAGRIIGRRLLSTGPKFDDRFQYIFEQPSKRPTAYKRLDDLSSGVKVVNDVVRPDGRKGKALIIEPEVLTGLSKRAILDISFLLRSSHLQQLSNILKDPDASPNDRFVTLELLKNASIASSRVLPGCQDTGTAIVTGQKHQYVWTDEDDERSIAQGIYEAYTEANLRYSQMAPLSMTAEKNTGCNLPAQIEIFAKSRSHTPHACTGSPDHPLNPSYDFLYIAKGGGSANKTFLYQKTKALLKPDSLIEFIRDAAKSIGTSACPPYHLAIVIGGLTAEQTLKTVKLASCRYLDGLPTEGNDCGRAFRDLEWEERVLEMTKSLGIGAQFGGKYFCHDVRVIRLPRHGASCPVGIGVSCSADRQALAKITSEGVFLEKLEEDPGRFLDELTDAHFAEETQSPADTQAEVIKVDLNSGMPSILAQLSKYPVTTRLSLSGTLIVARDIAHSKLQDILTSQGSLPEYFRQHPVYYAGPAKTPEGLPSGSFGPTTAGRMDPYVAPFMAAGGSMISLAKGNRSKAVTNACKKYGGFYLGSIGGPAAALAKNHIRKVEVLDFPELGMEAVWRIEVEDFPAFIVVDDKGNDFYRQWLG
eukprot:Lankesteria_metandrocarpae@DN4540_c0_g1_i1.p1